MQASDRSRRRLHSLEKEQLSSAARMRIRDQLRRQSAPQFSPEPAGPTAPSENHARYLAPPAQPACRNDLRLIHQLCFQRLLELSLQRRAERHRSWLKFALFLSAAKLDPRSGSRSSKRTARDPAD